ncbi:UDP-N-acetylglucosamine--N-acetylmuramyl-(Pentapeptide) pyrophosphoryl-undecaprenol N-acetylglucosamine transferase [Melia azedarach]|uniref:UDP-N-acetylglucosamine--N-acetylmuramyl-(Pentapeptide) pyrophosphoryl-undecaprenol N-acetylglucosamine transferase n=1 Tax=Melia azedarach TaxID=155640 RepID=A0ACC1XPV7_MELAZ|nr:UDP-N-acetylglucosamine--N-acetylmuramyl-(Pentapeptide) pyrophosphoryl-undecaprenol N-acetylglucosamine transferase [Melia azedarach]
MASFSLHSHPSTFPFYYSSLSTPSNSWRCINFQFRTSKISCCLSIQELNDVKSDADVNDNLRVVFAAGGTGGHIYPAVAIADELKIINPTTQILFMGSQNSMESSSVPSAGYDFVSVTTVPLYRPLLSPKNLLLPYRLIKSLIQCHSALKDFNPDIVVGTGGYVSFPTCLAAALWGIQVVIQEQNSVPGIANWVLSFLAEKVFVAFNSTIECFPRKDKCIACGNPVRLSLRTYVSKAVARFNFFPRLRKEEEAKTGVEAFNEMESLVRNHPHLLLTPFLHSIDLAYAAADLIVSRAGAMTCYEILATGKPAILIPSPNVAEGHQFKNASLMADVAGSRVIIEDELDSITLGTTIEQILGNEGLMAEMSERAFKAAKPGASAEIAQHILSLVESSTQKK